MTLSGCWTCEHLGEEYADDPICKLDTKRQRGWLFRPNNYHIECDYYHEGFNDY